MASPGRSLIQSRGVLQGHLCLRVVPLEGKDSCRALINDRLQTTQGNVNSQVLLILCVGVKAQVVQGQFPEKNHKCVCGSEKYTEGRGGGTGGSKGLDEADCVCYRKINQIMSPL